MLASRSVVAVLVRALGDFSLHPQGRPCGRPPAAAVLGRQDHDRDLAGVDDPCHADQRTHSTGDQQGDQP
jgi:hypothetical protein